MTRYQVVLASEDDIEPLAADMTDRDVEEVWATAHFTPAKALSESLRWSDQAYTGLVDGRPVCMFGIVNVNRLAGIGVPWLLTTNEMSKHPLAFLSRNKEWLEGVKETYGKLINYVDARNTVSIKWLGWLGFTVHEPAPYGVDGLPFCRFDLETK